MEETSTTTRIDIDHPDRAELVRVPEALGAWLTRPAIPSAV